MIVAIDGPAGAGKSTIARQLAERLGFRFLDTGAMYRAVTLAALRRKVPLDANEALRVLVDSLSIQLDGALLLLDGEDVSEEIRTSEVTNSVSLVADQPLVREALVVQQRAAAVGDLVTEGRDQGTIVFPDAECKIFLTASPEERAKRRQADLRERGQTVELSQVLADQQERDRRDSARRVGPLRQADDAIVVQTDGLSREQVLDRLATLVRQRMR